MINRTALLAFVLVFAVSCNGLTLDIDGVKDPQYVLQSSVPHDDNAPVNNFGSASSGTLGPSYNIYDYADFNNAYFFIEATSDDTPPLPIFSNLYFNTQPDYTRASRSQIAFETSASRLAIFQPGPGLPRSILGEEGVVAPVAGGNAPNFTLEIVIPIRYFTSGQDTRSNGASFTYDRTFATPSLPGRIQITLSQTLSYSVAGGESFGANRLGSLVLPGAPLSIADSSTGTGACNSNSGIFTIVKSGQALLAVDNAGTLYSCPNAAGDLQNVCAGIASSRTMDPISKRSEENSELSDLEKRITDLEAAIEELKKLHTAKKDV